VDGRILLIDDDAAIVSSLARLLAHQYEVVPLTSPREALRRIVAGERFDAIVCDLMMPDLGGVDLFERIREADPSQSDAMIFMTGGAFTAGDREFLDSIPNARLEKPFSAHELRALVRGRLLQPGSKA
jgi:CheY-like chemotaxis protein